MLDQELLDAGYRLRPFKSNLVNRQEWFTLIGPNDQTLTVDVNISVLNQKAWQDMMPPKEALAVINGLAGVIEEQAALIKKLEAIIEELA